MELFTYMENHTITKDLISSYNGSKAPVAVNFRKMIPHLRTADRSTHLIHPYPAKLLMHIPYFFISNSYFSSPGDYVLDPFSGSGTSLLEATLAGRKPLGADANPFARLLSKVKITPIEQGFLKKENQSLLERIQKKPEGPIPDVVNLDYWFPTKTTITLRCIRDAILKTINSDTREFYDICFSNCVRKVSLADPRVSVPVRLKTNKYHTDNPTHKSISKHLNSINNIDVLSVFTKVLQKNTERLSSIEHLRHNPPIALNIFQDAKNLIKPPSGTGIKENSVKLIVTSPPYPGAQKYIRSCSLSLGWLDLCSTKEIAARKRLIIGREETYIEEYRVLQKTGIKTADLILKDIFNVNPKRASIASNYIVEMRQALGEMHKVLKPNGHLVLVIANNYIAKLKFQTVEFLEEISKELGFCLVGKFVDDIKSRGLMTKRNKTANIINREWVLVLKKGANTL